MAQAMADTSTSRTTPLRHTDRIAAASAFSAGSPPPPPATEPSDPNGETIAALDWLGRVGSVPTSASPRHCCRRLRSSHSRARRGQI